MKVKLDAAHGHTPLGCALPRFVLFSIFLPRARTQATHSRPPSPRWAEGIELITCQKVLHIDSLLDVVNPAQIASEPTARLRIGFLILRRTKR
jgi:hypothetical protein